MDLTVAPRVEQSFIDGSAQSVTFLDEKFVTKMEMIRGLSTSRDRFNVFHVVGTMRERAAEHELDRIGGIVYILQPSRIPFYDRGQSPDDAWDTLLMLSTHDDYRAQLLFLFPAPGTGTHIWRPTWETLMDDATRLPSLHTFPRQTEQWAHVDKQKYGRNRCRVYGYLIENCLVEGLDSDPTAVGGAVRKGTFSFRGSDSETQSFDITVKLPL